MTRTTRKVKKSVITAIFFILAGATGINYTNAQRFMPITPSKGILSTAPNDSSIWVNRDLTIRDYSPTQLVEDIFVKSGGCASVSNVTLTSHGWNGTAWTNTPNSDNRGLGYFSRGTSNFEMESGLVLSTGGLVSIEGPNSSSMGIENAIDDPNAVVPLSDPDLVAIVGSTQTNYTSLEFDFVPTSSVIQFRYVFASEEYLNFVAQIYNDVFGFFISGPGIDGGNVFTNNAVNIATLPNGGGEVSIDNVNWGQVPYNNHNCATSTGPGTSIKNPDYYINIPGDISAFGSGCPFSDDPVKQSLYRSMEFNGRTVVLTATTPVLQTCETYHIKLAVGNVMDNAYQSGVFLEAKSFDLGGDLVNHGNNIAGMDYVYKGCADNKFVVPRSEADGSGDVYLPLIYGGTAVNGVDISLPGGGALPSSVTIPADKDSVEVYYQVNPSDPGAKTFTITTPCICGGTMPPKIIYIFDPAVFQITSTSNCSNNNDGSIKINVAPGVGNSGTYQSSIDGGTTWNSILEYTGLAAGTYSVAARDSGSCYTTARDVLIGAGSMVWSPENNTGSDTQNWNNPDNWTPMTVPMACDTVYIPGNSIDYPLLTGAAECSDIYFLYGAELGHPEKLTYQRAFVQYNFGLKQSLQITNQNDKSLVLNSNPTTDDRMRYSASVSATPIQRERWYMLSSPLKSVVTGDLEFGGFPLTFLKKFGPIVKDTKSYAVGEWTTLYNGMADPVAVNVTDGFAFYMFGYGNTTGDNTGCFESGSFNTLNDLSSMPDRSGKSYGIQQVNGILELPFFANSTNLPAHRTQAYNPPQSIFYSIWDDTYSSNFNFFTGNTESVTRNIATNENYRFAPETFNGTKWVFPTEVTHPVTDLVDESDFLVGNPFMSSIDMVQFLIDNATSVDSYFRVWNGNGFDDYEINTSTREVTSTNMYDDSPYISPLQGFFLSYKGAGAVRFNVDISTVVRPTVPFDLRSDAETPEVNLLRIKAENNYAASNAVIGYKDKASNDFVRGEDVRKLFSPFDYVPEIYSLAGDIPVDINFINGDALVPLGIKTGQTGNIRLTFTGMDNYSNVSKIEFIDALQNQTVDLTGKSSYTYSFNTTETGIQNGRFSLKVGNPTMPLTDINHPVDWNVYGDSKGIYVVLPEPVQKIEVYDFAGRKWYESNTDAKFYPLPGNLAGSPLIVRVTTKNNVKTVKIN